MNLTWQCSYCYTNSGADKLNRLPDGWRSTMGLRRGAAICPACAATIPAYDDLLNFAPCYPLNRKGQRAPGQPCDASGNQLPPNSGPDRLNQCLRHVCKRQHALIESVKRALPHSPANDDLIPDAVTVLTIERDTFLEEQNAAKTALGAKRRQTLLEAAHATRLAAAPNRVDAAPPAATANPETGTDQNNETHSPADNTLTEAIDRYTSAEQQLQAIDAACGAGWTGSTLKKVRDMRAELRTLHAKHDRCTCKYPSQRHAITFTEFTRTPNAYYTANCTCGYMVAGYDETQVSKHAADHSKNPNR